MLLLRPAPPTSLPLLRAITTKLSSPSPLVHAPLPAFRHCSPIAQSLFGPRPRSFPHRRILQRMVQRRRRPLCLLDRIYAALASCSDDDPSVDAALVPSRLPAFRSLVLRVLHHRPNPSHPSLLLLRASSSSTGPAGSATHRHSAYSAFHAIFRILSRCSLTSVVHSLLQ
ncbi:hypothetical protein J5N97_001464 [Dioscorea zingiberensis]|uniref:Uncharacterized protein n=1 Tax=Dioscorea zingiberensis TaxID=325984 RepID=A0A9D5H271_9LILI|nr:hypothetical protein J5N97_001464 [Dioscorea zingiberensis]